MIRCAQCKKPIEGFHVVLAYETGSKQFCDHKCADLYAGSRERSGEPPAGSKRDLKADLELCNRATPGPWIEGENLEEVIIKSANGTDVLLAVWFDNVKWVGVREEDLNLFLQAREGWPHAIERAIEAEELNRELVDVLGRVTPRYLAGRLELDLDLVHEANGLLKKAKEVLGDEETCAGRQSASAKDY